MVLLLIGIAFTLYVIREIVRLWHAPDNVRWIGPLRLASESVSEPELEAKLLSDIRAQQKASGAGGRQKSTCVHRRGSEKPTSESICCCDQVKPKPTGGAGALVESSYEYQTAKLVALLPKEVRDMILEEAYEAEKMRRQSNALAHFIANLESVASTPPSSEPTPSEPSADFPPAPESTPAESPAETPAPVSPPPGPALAPQSAPPVGTPAPESTPTGSIPESIPTTESPTTPTPAPPAESVPGTNPEPQPSPAPPNDPNAKN